MARLAGYPLKIKARIDGMWFWMDYRVEKDLSSLTGFVREVWKTYT